MRRTHVVSPCCLVFVLPFVAGCPVCQTDDDCGPCETCVGQVACVPLELGQCCQGDTECNDGEPCTTDSCGNGSCQHVENTNTCNDGDPCTTNDRCSEGACSGAPINCDDDDACTEDECVLGVCRYNQPDSDEDGVPDCADQCSGTPSGTAVDENGCPIGTLPCTSDADCDDSDACTGDRCVSAQCQNDPIDGCPCDATNLLLNGNFEIAEPFDPNPCWREWSGCRSDAVQNWTLCNGEYQMCGDNADGTVSLDLNSCEPGTASQDFATSPGTRYAVRFALSANRGGGPDVKRMRVTAGGQSDEFEFPISEEGWAYHSWEFTATTASTTLQFESLVEGCYGPLLDDVSAHATSNSCTTDADCPDDGVFCNGVEICDDGCCGSTGLPCAPGQTCDEVGDQCSPGEICADNAQCDDGVFCNGVEFCADGECQSCLPPCASGQICDEATDTCTPNGAPGDSIHSGETLSGSIEPVSDTDSYTFTADANDTLIIQMNADWLPFFGNDGPCFDVFGSQGGEPEVFVCTGLGQFGASLSGYQLQESGRYTIVLRDGGADATGSYNVSLLILSGPAVFGLDRDGGAICPNQVLEARIDPAADTDAYTFDALIGNTVVIQMNADWLPFFGNDGPCFDLFAPTGGEPEGSACAGLGQFGATLTGHRLQESGRYSIVVRDGVPDSTGAYSLSLNIIP